MLKANLNDVLRAIGKQLSLEPKSLIKYAQEAPHAATRPDGNLWPSGTGSISEKRILYAITRALNPMLSLDIGTRWGSSATQLASGDNDAPKPNGRVISVDNESTIHGSKQKVGKFIPDMLGVSLVTSDAIQYLKRDKNFYEIIYEDSAHTYEMTRAIYKLAYDRIVDGGVIISHDAVHPKFKGAVVEGIKACGIEPEVYLVEGDSCGLAIWQKPSDKIAAHEEASSTVASYSWDTEEGEITKGVYEPEEQPTPIHIANPPRRKRRKKASKMIEE